MTTEPTNDPPPAPYLSIFARPTVAGGSQDVEAIVVPDGFDPDAATPGSEGA